MRNSLLILPMAITSQGKIDIWRHTVTVYVIFWVFLRKQSWNFFFQKLMCEEEERWQLKTVLTEFPIKRWSNLRWNVFSWRAVHQDWPTWHAAVAQPSLKRVLMKSGRPGSTNKTRATDRKCLTHNSYKVIICQIRDESGRCSTKSSWRPRNARHMRPQQ